MDPTQADLPKAPFTTDRPLPPVTSLKLRSTPTPGLPTSSAGHLQGFKTPRWLTLRYRIAQDLLYASLHGPQLVSEARGGR